MSDGIFVSLPIQRIFLKCNLILYTVYPPLFNLGYVFCPGPNVFVHHSSLPPQFINPGSQSVSNAHQLAKFQTPNIDPTVAQQQQQLEVLNSSPTRKRRLNNLHPPSTSQNEVKKITLIIHHNQLFVCSES